MQSSPIENTVYRGWNGCIIRSAEKISLVTNEVENITSDRAFSDKTIALDPAVFNEDESQYCMNF